MAAIPAPNPCANDKAACQRKRRFKKLREALALVDRRGLDQSAYKCRECGGFHLTKMGARA